MIQYENNQTNISILLINKKMNKRKNNQELIRKKNSQRFMKMKRNKIKVILLF